MKVGDFVKVDYIGRIKDSGDIFDLTMEDVAKKENIHREDFAYAPVVLIVGSDFIIKGLDDALREMKVGDKKKFDVLPERGFGERKEELVKVIPATRFKEQDMKPYPGAVINVGSFRGKVISVDGGRVKVDFNHPLAGKALEYELEIKAEITEIGEKVKSLVKYFTGLEEVGVEQNGTAVSITILKDVDVVRPVKKMVSEAVMKWCRMEKVSFVEIFENPQKSDGKNER